MAYYEVWHRFAKEAVGPLSVEEARRLETAGEPFTVVVGDPQQPHCFIEVSEGCYGVSFLDDRKREHLMYAFEDTGGGKLFLKEALNREFEGVTDEVARGTTYRFSVDGRVRIERAEKPFREATVTETQADVSKNWEARPSFGEYSRLIRKDR